MKINILLTLVLALLLGAAGDVALAQKKVLPVKFESYNSGTKKDSATVKYADGKADTTQWVFVPDSSAQGGGISFSFWTNDDSTAAKVEVQWAVYDPVTELYVPYMTKSTLDSLISFGHTGATRNPSFDKLHYRKPPGATYARAIVTPGATVGYWPNNAGTKSMPVLRGQYTYPQF